MGDTDGNAACFVVRMRVYISVNNVGKRVQIREAK